MGTTVVVILIIILLIVVVGVLAAVGGYNGLVKLRNLVQESWRQVDVELNRRYELLPNLVETVRGYAAHERNTLEGVTQLRNQAVAVSQQSGGTIPTEQRAQIEEQLSGAVRQLMVSVEAYPDLKSNQNFLELQQQLAETEDRIANGRRYYNANVRAYNTKIESIPTNIIAGMFTFEKATYFEVNDQAVRQAPSVSFGEIADRPGGQPALPAQQSNSGGQQWPQDPPPQQQWQPQQQPQQWQQPQSQPGQPPAPNPSQQWPQQPGGTQQ